MSLHVYLRKEDIPNGMPYVILNDAWFNENVRVENDTITERLLFQIDGARYADVGHFYPKIDPEGKVRFDYLSTGCKTALNVYNASDVCFDVRECGENAIAEILHLDHGNIYWGDWFVSYAGDNDEVDVIVDNMRFRQAHPLINYIIKEWADPEDYEVVE